MTKTKVAATKTAVKKKKVRACDQPDFVWPEKLSKAGIWLRDNPNGLGFKILDMRAVMR